MLGLLLSAGLRFAACSLLVAVAVRFVFQVVRMLWVARDIPGPPSLLVGTVLPLLRLQSDFLGTIQGLLQRYGTVWRLWFANQMIVSISEPEDVQVFFNHPAMQDKPSLLYDGLITVVGQGLVSMPGNDMHKIYRKVLDPTFSPDALRAFMPIFQRHSTVLCDKMEPFATSGESFAVSTFTEDITVDVLVEAVVGADEDLAEDRERLARVLAGGDKMVIWLACRPWFTWAPLRRLLCSRAKEVASVRSGIDRYARTMVNKWMPSMRAAQDALRDGKSPDAAQEALRAAEPARTIIGDLVFSRYILNMDEEDLKTGVLHVCVAGVAASADLLMMCMQTLALLPEVQENIYREVMEVVPSESRPVTVSELSSLRYLDRVLRETLRYFPSVHTIGRYAKADVALPSGKVIPRGSSVILSLFNNMRDERWFPDPHKFDPDRFLPENCAKRPWATYTPFSSGPRNCIGHRFARLYAKTVLSSVLRRFRVLPAPEGHKALDQIKFIAGVSLHPIGEVRVRLEPRTARSTARETFHG